MLKITGKCTELYDKILNFYPLDLGIGIYEFQIKYALV